MTGWRRLTPSSRPALRTSGSRHAGLAPAATAGAAVSANTALRGGLSQHQRAWRHCGTSCKRSAIRVCQPGPRGAPLVDDLFGQTKRNQLPGVRQPWAPAFVDLGSCQHFIGQFRKVIVFIRLDDMGVEPFEIRAQFWGSASARARWVGSQVIFIWFLYLQKYALARSSGPSAAPWRRLTHDRAAAQQAASNASRPCGKIA